MSGEQLEPGTLLNDRYRILRVIGKGGMGTVYQAEHVRLDTILAVKEVRAPKMADADSQVLLEQCQHEARFLVRLHHPNLPQVTDAFLEDDRFYVVMEYIEGVTLEARERLAGAGGLMPSTVVEWALQIADVLAYLHGQSPPIIFRDLKPANVMIQADGRIRLIDFGIARRFQPGAVKDTNLLGSVGYSPPEQFGRHQTDTRTDIYAFGATLHNLLTGKDPSHSPFKFVPARTLNPAVPDRLSRLIDCCLRLDADARPQTIHEVAMELLALKESLPADAFEQAVPPAASAAEPLVAGPPSGPNIILTNAALRNTGKTQRGSQKVASSSLGSDKLGSRPLTGANGGVSPYVPSATFAPLSPASDRLASPEPRSAMPAWIAAIVTVAALAGLAVWVLNSHPKHPGLAANVPARDAHEIAATPEKVTPDPPKTVPEHPSTAPAVTPADDGTAPMTMQKRAVNFDSVVVKGVSVDPQGQSWLHIEAAGTAQGMVGDQEVIAAFFYNSQSAQVESHMPQTPYSSKDGHLSVATTLTLTSISQPFDLQLDLPLAAFPPNITDNYQFHCVAFYGSQRIGETKEYIPVSPAMLAPGGAPTQIPGQNPAAPQNPSTPAPDNGSATHGNSTPHQPGTFGSSPVRLD